MTSHFLEQILSTIEPDIKKVTFIGGEPTIHPEILTLLGIVKDYGMKTILWTSGTFEVGHLLAKTDELRVSRNGFSDEHCSVILGNPCLSRVTLRQYMKETNLVITCIPGLGGITTEKFFWKWYNYYSECSPAKFLILPVNSEDPSLVYFGKSLTDTIRPNLPNNVFEEIDYESDMRPGWNDYYAVGDKLFRSYTQGNITELRKVIL
jgi:hypothetical protein